MRLSNTSTSAVLRSFAMAALTPDDGVKLPADILVWVEFAPQHPKVVGALWASLVGGSAETLQLRDDNDAYLRVQGLGRRYERFAVDAPRLAGRARPKFLRLIAPEAITLQKPGEAFIVFEWPGQTAGQTLAAMLETGTPLPIRIDWGDYLLAEALARGCAKPLLTSSKAPRGYLVSGKTPWEAMIAEGVRSGHITLLGQTVSSPEREATPWPVEPAAQEETFADITLEGDAVAARPGATALVGDATGAGAPARNGTRHPRPGR